MSDTAHELVRPPESASGNPGLDALAETVDDAIGALQSGVGEDSDLLRRFCGLSARLQHGHLHLAVLGQFKRGKSTFINALLGAPVLPVGVVPLTAVPVFIAWRETPYVRVQFGDGRAAEELATQEPGAIRDFLFCFVAEEANPDNYLRVSRVDLFYPATFLASGAVLIDTPGVGSTLRHNTEAALAVLAECDAALVVLSADPPITEAELDYLNRVKARAARIFYVLNKMDYLDVEEGESVATFLRAVLEKNGLWMPASRIFRVSARKGLEARQSGHQSAFEMSGLAAVEAHLLRELAAEKSRLFEAAMSGKIRDALFQASAEIALRIQTLKLPVEKLTAKAALFEARLGAIEERERVTRDVLAGEQRALRQGIEVSTAALRAPRPRPNWHGCLKRIWEPRTCKKRSPMLLCGYSMVRARGWSRIIPAAPIRSSPIIGNASKRMWTPCAGPPPSFSKRRSVRRARRPHSRSGMSPTG